MTKDKAIKTLTARWATPEGAPFKGELISADGCMCAQGQALHFIGGYSAEDLRKMAQNKADKETARLLGISLAHSILLRNVNDSIEGVPSIVLTNPEKVLGDQAQTVLAFWRYLDRMDAAVWAEVGAAAWGAAWDAAWAAAWDAAGAAAWDVAGDAAWDAAWDVARDVARDVVARDAARGAAMATNEIQGAEFMRDKGQPFYFLPLFGFADPEAVLATDLAIKESK